jgi:2-oxoglutarate ferredoxin oxidoreductase subunit alpha
VYSERSEDWHENTARLARKFASIQEALPAPEVDLRDEEGADLLIVCMGSTRYAIDEARARLEASGDPTSFMRIRALPFGPQVQDALRRHASVVVVEMNRDGQLCDLLRSTYPDLAPRIHSLAYLDGLPYTADQVTSWVAPHLRPGRSATTVEAS